MADKKDRTIRLTDCTQRPAPNTTPGASPPTSTRVLEWASTQLAVATSYPAPATSDQTNPPSGGSWSPACARSTTIHHAPRLDRSLSKWGVCDVRASVTTGYTVCSAVCALRRMCARPCCVCHKHCSAACSYISSPLSIHSAMFPHQDLCCVTPVSLLCATRMLNASFSQAHSMHAHCARRPNASRTLPSSTVHPVHPLCSHPPRHHHPPTQHTHSPQSLSVSLSCYCRVL